MIQGISATKNITYIDVDERAILRHEARGTGSSRYFNWVGELKKYPDIPDVCSSNIDLSTRKCRKELADVCENAQYKWIRRYDLLLRP